MFIRKFIKKQLILAVITFLMLGVVILGSSYALFQKTVVDEKTQSLNIGDLNIAFLQKNQQGNFEDQLADTNAISLNNIFPKTDAEATSDDNNIYTFVIHNSGAIAYSYKISLDDTENKCTTNDCVNLYPFLRYKLNDDNPWMLGNLVELNACDETSDKWSCQIYNYVINPGETHSFTLKLWLAEASKYNVPDEVLGKEAHLNINIEGEATNIRAPKGWTYAKEGTLLYGIKQNQDRAYNENYNPKNKALTTPGQQISTIDEGLRDAQDDYGTSYYFRGAVDNNYVVFAKMCWRIVRIDGQGNTKLVLYNYNSDKENITNPCNVTGGNLAFARYSGDTYKSIFNTNYNKNTYVGYMYSNTPDSSNYLEAHANDNDSTILTNLKTWYDANFNDTQKNLLADTIWCNDKRLAENGYTPNGDTSYVNTGLGAQNTAYAATQRLVSDTAWAAKADATPILKCGRTREDNKISKFTAQDTTYGNAKLNTTKGGTTKYYKIGLLTADEIAYAGGKFIQDNTSYYLNQNASSSYWWSLSQFNFKGSVAYVFGVHTSGFLANAYVHYTDFAVRPAVSLIPTVKYTVDTESEYNPGTMNNPFVITGI